MENAKQQTLFKAIGQILRPLVRLLIHQGVVYTTLIDLIKRVYVEVAAEEFQPKGKRITDSRISVMTGVHRGEVKRLRALAQQPLSAKEIKASKNAQLIAKWSGHSAYLDAQGQPKPLSRQALEELVLSISKDKHPRTMIDHLLEQQLVAEKAGLYYLNSQAYVPSEDFEEKLFFAGKNLGEHIAVVAHNLAEAPPRFDRALYYSDLSEASVQALQVEFNNHMMQLLQDLNHKAAQLQQQDAQEEGPKFHIHLGGYANVYRQQAEEKAL